MHPVKPSSGRLVRADHVVREIASLPIDEARALVESLPAEDLLHLTRGLRHADTLMIVEHASTDQIQRMVDLDAWRGDQFDLQRFVDWTALLNEISQEKAVAFLQEVDVEYPTLAVLKAGRVVDRRDLDEGDAPFDEEAEEGIPSPDNQFVVIVPLDDPMVRPIRTLLDFLYAGDIEHARMVLQAARWELSASLEENLLRFRNGRLEEMGIPDLDRARRLLRPLSVEQEARLLARPTLGDVGFVAERVTDLLLVPFHQHADGVLEAAVAALSDDQRAVFAQGTSSVAHKLAVVRGDDPSDAGALTRAMQTVADHLRLALDVLAPRAEAADLIASVHPEHLFRVAHTRLIALRARATRILAPLGGHTAWERFDEPWRDVLERLLLPIPEFARPGLVRLDLRAFTTVAELSEAGALLDVVAHQARFLADLLASAADVPGLGSVPFRRLLCTAVANRLLGRAWSFVPLPRADLSVLVHEAVAVVEGQSDIRPDVRARLLADFDAFLRGAYADAADEAFLRDLRALLTRALEHLAGALGGSADDSNESAGIAAEALLVEGEEPA